jgi:hypothetical protein
MITVHLFIEKKQNQFGADYKLTNNDVVEYIHSKKIDYFDHKGNFLINVDSYEELQEFLDSDFFSRDDISDFYDDNKELFVETDEDTFLEIRADASHDVIDEILYKYKEIK